MLVGCFSDQMPKDDTKIRSLVLVGRRRAQNGTQKRVLMMYPASNQKWLTTKAQGKEEEEEKEGKKPLIRDLEREQGRK